MADIGHTQAAEQGGKSQPQGRGRKTVQAQRQGPGLQLPRARPQKGLSSRAPPALDEGHLLPLLGTLDSLRAGLCLFLFFFFIFFFPFPSTILNSVINYWKLAGSAPGVREKSSPRVSALPTWAGV